MATIKELQDDLDQTHQQVTRDLLKERLEQLEQLSEVLDLNAKAMQKLDAIRQLVEGLQKELRSAESETNRWKSNAFRYKKRMEYYKTQLDRLESGIE